MKIKILLLISLLVYSVNAFAQTARSRTEPIKVGETVPDFALKDQNGNEVKLSDVGQNVMLVFYRGYWCPFCFRQLSELRTLLKADDKVKVFAVTVDNAMRNKSVIERLGKDGKGEFTFPILTDEGHKTIDAFGVFDPAYIGQEFEGIPHPAIYILDKDRKVLFAKVEPDYKKRPTNAELRVELDKLK
ncbi:MAG TPA: peroxiredoxin family protein [Pyrinomonadaceae bacterium]|nr:peroxiredoxin family protein [Pyrinomonadaceae bacterium]